MRSAPRERDVTMPEVDVASTLLLAAISRLDHQQRPASDGGGGVVLIPDAIQAIVREDDVKDAAAEFVRDVRVPVKVAVPASVARTPEVHKQVGMTLCCL